MRPSASPTHDLWSGAWTSALKGDSLTVVCAATIKLLGDPGPDPVRLVQCVIAAFAVLLLTVAVHDLAGRGAALATATLLLLEPSSMFFTTILQKESLVLLGESLAAFSVARLWRHDVRGAAVLAAAAIVVTGSARPYAAGFLAAGLLVCALHWAVVHAGGARKAVVGGLALAAVASGVLFVSSGAAASSLDRLQEFQRIETDSHAALRLDQVDFTTIGGAAQAIPQRLIDFVLRPLPWQLANNEQRLGAVGTVLAWSLALGVVAGLVLGRLRRRAIPLLYLAATVWLGYAVTSANAGTGFRHRLHLVVLLVAIGSILWSSAPAARRAGARVSSLRIRLG